MFRTVVRTSRRVASFLFTLVNDRKALQTIETLPGKNLLLVSSWKNPVLEQRKPVKGSDFQKCSYEKRGRLIRDMVNSLFDFMDISSKYLLSANYWLSSGGCVHIHGKYKISRRLRRNPSFVVSYLCFSSDQNISKPTYRPESFHSSLVYVAVCTSIYQ